MNFIAIPTAENIRARLHHLVRNLSAGLSIFRWGAFCMCHLHNSPLKGGGLEALLHGDVVAAVQEARDRDGAVARVGRRVGEDAAEFG